MNGDHERMRIDADRISWRSVDGEVVVLDLESSTYFSANESGAALWPKLIDGATRAELVELLRQTYSIDEATAARDVDAFVSVLADHGLLLSA